MRTVHSSSRISGVGVGVCSWGGVSAPRGVVCSWGVSAPREVSAPRGVSAPGGCLLLGRGVVSHHALRQTPPCGQTDACKNTTFATSLRMVKIQSTFQRNCNQLRPVVYIDFPCIVQPIKVARPNLQGRTVVTARQKSGERNIFSRVCL